MSRRVRLATQPWRGWSGSRPPRPVLLTAGLAALAWVVLALNLVPMAIAVGASHGGASASPGAPWICGLSGMHMVGVGPGGSGGAASVGLAGMPMWSLMALAMMLPAALPATAHVATNSLRRRRGRAVAEFLVAYLAPWLVFGALGLVGLALLPLDQTTALPVAVLGLAAAWELSPAKRWALNRCHRTSPLPPSGWRASLGAARFGVLHGGACVASCWPLMLVMAVAPSGRLAWCAGLAGLSAAEKVAQRPGRASRRVAVLLGLATTAVALALVIGV